MSNGDFVLTVVIPDKEISFFLQICITYNHRTAEFLFRVKGGNIFSEFNLLGNFM